MLGAIFLTQPILPDRWWQCSPRRTGEGMTTCQAFVHPAIPSLLNIVSTTGLVRLPDPPYPVATEHCLQDRQRHGYVPCLCLSCKAYCAQWDTVPLCTVRYLTLPIRWRRYCLQDRQRHGHLPCLCLSCKAYCAQWDIVLLCTVCSPDPPYPVVTVHCLQDRQRHGIPCLFLSCTAYCAQWDIVPLCTVR